MTDRPLRILYVSPEVVPFSKTGGLADVAGALPTALAQNGCDVRVLSPFYGHLLNGDFRTERVATPPLAVTIAGCSQPFHLRTLTGGDSAVRHFFIEHAPYYSRPELYVDPRTSRDYTDNDERFALLARGLIEWIRQDRWHPDIIHLNDWQSALVAPYLALLYRADPVLAGVRTVLSVHNLAYQGLFPAERFDGLGFPADQFYPTSPFEFWGKVGFLKAGLTYADKLSTVSPTYAREIQESEEFGCGLEHLLRERAEDLTGILNGIDNGVWNPAVDGLITRTFSVDDLSGKADNKNALCRRCGFAPQRFDRPLVGMISRIAEQKGFDLIAKAGERLFALDLNLVLLGTGDPEFHELFEKWNRRFAGQFRAFLTFDNALAHQIEAGADLFLMPSRYEPCGLNQMYSLRYGTVPIVRATGGLADTVRDADVHPDGNGFVFAPYDGEAMLAAVRRAVAAYGDRPRWRGMMRRGMSADFSWQASARRYVALYDQVIAAPARRVGGSTAPRGVQS
ncbi:MAG: glycogen synthase GlgA [Candidatus Zixiibacteriota bacterium]